MEHTTWQHITRPVRLAAAVLASGFFLSAQAHAQFEPQPKSGTVTSQALAGIPVPAQVRLDFASDVEDMAPFILAMEEALKSRGIDVSKTGEYILTIRLGQGRLSYRSGSQPARTDLTEPSPMDHGDTLLGKKTIQERTDNAQIKVPLGKKRRDTSDVSISFTLFKPGQSPIWLANASAPDDGRELNIQAARLMNAGVQSIGKTEIRTFGE